MGLSGCVGGGSSGSTEVGDSSRTEVSTATGTDQLTVAYVPIYPNMHHYVMREEGYYDALSADVTVERFSDGPSVVKAFASDEVDIALFGITPAMVLVSKGKQASVVAANSRNGFRVGDEGVRRTPRERTGRRVLGVREPARSKGDVRRSTRRERPGRRPPVLDRAQSRARRTGRSAE
jgi:ABC-type nitrate/sulfonate/bicarbonate transport system substrate-binding protein